MAFIGHFPEISELFVDLHHLVMMVLHQPLFKGVVLRLETGGHVLPQGVLEVQVYHARLDVLVLGAAELGIVLGQVGIQLLEHAPIHCVVREEGLALGFKGFERGLEVGVELKL